MPWDLILMFLLNTSGNIQAKNKRLFPTIRCVGRTARSSIHPNLHLAISKWKCSALYYAKSPAWEVFKNDVSLLWSSSLPRSAYPQWQMLRSETPGGPLPCSVLPGEAMTRDQEWESLVRQLRRNSRTFENVGSLVSKVKAIVHILKNRDLNE